MPDYPDEFALADSLAMHDEAERAVVLLDSLRPSLVSADRAIRAYFDLLTVKAHDKADHAFTSDSIIENVVHYYEAHPSLPHLAESYYYGGRVHSEMGDAPTALRYFLKAEEQIAEATMDENTVHLQTVVYSNIGTIYRRLNCDSIALQYIYQALANDILVGDSVGMVYGLRDIGDCHWGFRNLDSTEYYFERALQIAEAIHDEELSSMMHQQLVAVLMNEKKYDDIPPHLPALTELAAQNRSPYIYTLGNYYMDVEQVDSAICYFNKVMEYGNVYAKQSAARSLGVLYAGCHDYLRAANSFLKYEELSDSVLRLQNVEAVQRLHHIYNYEKAYDDNVRLRERNAIYTYYICIAVAICAVLMAVIFIVNCYRIKVKEELVQNRLKLDNNTAVISELEKLLLKFSNVKSGLERQIVDLKTEIEHISDSMRKQKGEIVEMKQTSAYSELQSLIKSRSKMSDKCLQDLEDAFARHNSQFLINLHNSGQYDRDEYALCLLIRLRIKPSQIANLLCMSPQNVTKKRKTLYNRVCRVNKAFSSLDDWDEFIMSL